MQYILAKSFFEEHVVTERIGHHKAIVISDSMLKNCLLPKHSDLYAVGGATVSTLYRSLVHGNIPVQDYQLIIVHIGTNDYGNDEVDNFKCNIDLLVRTIHRLNSNAKIVLSGIIPRPRDHVSSKATIKHMNNIMKKYAACRQSFVKYFKTYKL